MTLVGEDDDDPDVLVDVFVGVEVIILVGMLRRRWVVFQAETTTVDVVEM